MIMLTMPFALSSLNPPSQLLQIPIAHAAQSWGDVVGGDPAPGITERAPLVVVLAEPVATIEEVIAKDGRTLPKPVQLDDDGPEYPSAARLISALSAVMIWAGTPAGAPTPFQLVTA